MTSWSMSSPLTATFGRANGGPFEIRRTSWFRRSARPRIASDPPAAICVLHIHHPSVHLLTIHKNHTASPGQEAGSRKQEAGSRKQEAFGQFLHDPSSNAAMIQCGRIHSQISRQ
ncbi:hypothetical protein Cni_G10544 [Canna indica]|uniref:Uncharacterized protein n=1 Tax=Canna indica TaxID=4628 RepID=A0AAQ3K4P8_9LILI|nr:hypothetical protein Cni_G10544 [Canna indica]